MWVPCGRRTDEVCDLRGCLIDLMVCLKEYIMAGAYSITNVGDIGLQITDKFEPDITVVTLLNRSKVYVRRTKEWKEAIAEFVTAEHAEFFADTMKKGTIK